MRRKSICFTSNLTMNISIQCVTIASKHLHITQDDVIREMGQFRMHMYLRVRHIATLCNQLSVHLQLQNRSIDKFPNFEKKVQFVINMKLININVRKHCKLLNYNQLYNYLITHLTEETSLNLNWQ